jgi:chondroitin sulfate synthase
MQDLFYHSFDENASYTRDLLTAEILNAITLHPYKQPKYLYRFHNFLQSRRIMGLRHKRLSLQRSLYTTMTKSETDSKDNLPVRFMRHPSLKPIDSFYNCRDYDFLTVRSIFSQNNAYPKRGLETFWKKSINETMRQTMQILNKDTAQYGKVFFFEKFDYAYIRVNPLIGVDYVMENQLYTNTKKRSVKTLRQYAKYARQTFTDLIFREDNGLHSIYHDSKNNVESRNFFEKFEDFLLPYGTEINSNSDVAKKVIHFILPLTGRLSTFKRFMDMFEIICLQTEEPVKLAIVLFNLDDDDDKETIHANSEIKKIVESIKRKYSNDIFYLVELKLKFSRSIGCEAGASLFAFDALLFFIDVDMVFTRDALIRIRLNTVEKKQVYYPIVFSQYDPNPGIFGIKKSMYKRDFFNFNTDYGNWRQSGFGMLSVYYGDLKRVGGFDTSIVGWGKEDVDLYDKFLKSNLTVFRSVEPGLIHVFHKIRCDPNLPVAQLDMCLGYKTLSIVSQRQLANIIHKGNLYEVKNISNIFNDN